MSFDSKRQRQIMGRLATGVTVVSTKAGDDGWGMTANAVTSLSLEPPLVLVAVVRDSQTHTYLQDSRFFAVNILSEEQEELSNRFAFKGPKDFSDLEVETAITGAPILKDAIGWVDCRLTEILPGGDHDIFIGEIVAGDVGDGRPLIFHEGKYRRLAD
jgi:flavin reductase (DIM6/NTAB) family NADH-FMN oxidoreductase RutF